MNHNDIAVTYTASADSRGSHPLWKIFLDEEKEALAAQYEAYRSGLIAKGSRSLKDFEARWQRGYGFAGPMASVVADMQAENNANLSPAVVQ